MQFISLPGLVAYEEARQLQLEWVERRYRNEVEDTVLFLEHQPVITRGRGLQFTGLPRDRHMPLPMGIIPEGIAFAESERGGDLTYHGPGQLVMYPIVKLDGSGFGPDHDVAGFLRKIEGAVSCVLTDWGLTPTSRENATGVWLGEKKIASMGIAVRKWVTYHGIAINCVNDLHPFYLFSPCGYTPEVMTRLADWVPQGADWRQNMESALERQLSC